MSSVCYVCYVCHFITLQRVCCELIAWKYFICVCWLPWPWTAGCLTFDPYPAARSIKDGSSPHLPLRNKKKFDHKPPASISDTSVSFASLTKQFGSSVNFLSNLPPSPLRQASYHLFASCNHGFAYFSGVCSFFFLRGWADRSLYMLKGISYKFTRDILCVSDSNIMLDTNALVDFFFCITKWDFIFLTETFNQVHIVK